MRYVLTSLAVEDPFSVLSVFVPDPPSRPHLVPLYPPLYNPPSDPSSSQTQTPHPATPVSTFPAATTLPLDHRLPDLSLLQSHSDSTGKQPRRCHWTIVRNVTWRQKGKEREDEADGTKVAELPPWRMPREAQATDFGSFAVLAGELAEEMRRRGMIPPDTEKETVDHEVNMELIRERLDCQNAAKKLLPVENASINTDLAHVNGADLIAKNYWTTQRAAEAEEYVRDLVYGGVEGLAYVRSLAEFVDGNCYHKEEVRAPLLHTSTFTYPSFRVPQRNSGPSLMKTTKILAWACLWQNG